MLSQIDWSHPWYDSVRAAFGRLGLEATTKPVTIGPLEASPQPVILAQAGIHASYPIARSMDSRLRGNDGLEEESPQPVILAQAGIHASYPIPRSMDSRL
ncbi:MAG: hypothetical protein WA191_04190, partial [Telluria sp.]